MTSTSVRAGGAIAASLVGLLLLAGCSGTPAAPDTERSQKPSASAEPAPTPTGQTVAGLEDAFAERDAFFAEQKFPTDGSLPRANTATQKELVQKQSDWVKSKGGTWTEQDESILLAMASDTCETGILNGHNIDAALLKKVIVGSPMLPKSGTPEQQAALEKNFASVSVFGATYLCPDDGEAWTAAFDKAYGK
jgi:hypothetical protein